MTSAREIAATCLPPIDDCDMGAECSECMGDNEARDRIAEAIQQARVDGAKWGGENAQNGCDTACWIDDETAEKVHEVAP